MAKRRTRAPLSVLSHSIHSKVALLWMKRCSPLYKVLSTNILREVCEFFTLHQLLAECEMTKIIVFDLTTKLFQVIKLRQIGILLQYSVPGQCVVLEDNRIFACDGRLIPQFTERCVTLAFMTDGKNLTSLSNMQYGRFWHGLYFDKGTQCVFAFGGDSNSADLKKTCEQYEIANGSWSLLPDMKEGKVNVVVCGYRNSVFVCGNRSNLIEIFSIASKEFTVIPKDKFIGRKLSVPIVWKNKLMIFSNYFVKEFDANTYTAVTEWRNAVMIGKKSQMAANNMLFWLEGDACFSLNLETMRRACVECLDT